jgi:hypothetical protein
VTSLQFIDEGLFSISIECDVSNVVYVKSIATAYDGLCCLFSDGGSKVHLVAPKGREAEVELLVNDLVEELAARRVVVAC